MRTVDPRIGPHIRNSFYSHMVTERDFHLRKSKSSNDSVKGREFNNPRCPVPATVRRLPARPRFGTNCGDVKKFEVESRADICVFSNMYVNKIYNIS